MQDTRKPSSRRQVLKIIIKIMKKREAGFGLFREAEGRSKGWEADKQELRSWKSLQEKEELKQGDDPGCCFAKSFG